MTEATLCDFEGKLIANVLVDGSPDLLFYGTQVYRKSSVENTYVLIPNYVGAQAVALPEGTTVTGESEDPILTNLQPVASWLG